MKLGKNCKLQWHLHPIPTIRPKIYGEDYLFRTPSLPRESPDKRNMYGDEISTFQAQDQVGCSTIC